jgi:hypothetical protein
MKPWRFAPVFLLLSLATPAFSQSAAHPHDGETKPVTDGAKAFEKLKGLAGSWAGQITTTPRVADVDQRFVQFSMKVTSRGNALVHDLSVSGLPDHPLTMFYLDAGKLTLTHYCDAGNRPRMVGRISPDGQTLEFDFLDLAGGNEHGHMHHAVFTILDENHHTEDWTYMLPGDVATRAHFDLQRTNFQDAGSR